MAQKSLESGGSTKNQNYQVRELPEDEKSPNPEQDPPVEITPPEIPPSENEFPRPEQNEETKENSSTKEIDYTTEVLMFHNGRGAMCLEALDFFEKIDFPVTEFLTSEVDFRNKLERKKADNGTSEGVSTSFGYYPMIFVNDRAFSGFNEEVKEGILEEIVK